MFCRVCNISVRLCLKKQVDICPKNVVSKNPELCKICDGHVFHSDLYFSIWVTKLDAVKGSNRTYPYSKESVKLWWVYAWENMQKSVPKVLQPKFPIYAKFAIDIPKLSPGSAQDVPKSPLVLPSQTNVAPMKPAYQVQ